MSDAADERIAALERALAGNPSGEAFPALAERLRRAGRLAEAERVARDGLAGAPDSATGRAVLALVLADAGRDAELRRRLEAWAAAALEEAPAAPPAAVLLPDDEAAGSALSPDELDRAFAGAALEREAMITPDSVAEEAALHVDGSAALESPLESGGAFTTATMADLLERQGDHAGAARIRARITPPAPATPAAAAAPAAPAPARSDPTLDVLEHWLDNARRMQS